MGGAGTEPRDAGRNQQKKAADWKTGFWGEKSIGWHYEVLMITMNLVIVTMGPGKLSL
jgi:hypothetical protein